MAVKLGGKGSLRFCSCPLALADHVWHRVMVNKQTAMQAARALGMGKTQVVGVLRILRHCGQVPSKARLALVAMRVPDVTDADIAEWFEESLDWARAVRREADALRAAEPIPVHLEYTDDGYRPGDPDPAEIARRAREIRLATLRSSVVDRVEMKAYQWNGRSYASIPLGT